MTRPPEREPTSAVELLPVDEAAIALARKWKLVNAEGQVECLKGCGRLATLPSLCCRECLAARQRGWR